MIPAALPGLALLLALIVACPPAQAADAQADPAVADAFVRDIYKAYAPKENLGVSLNSVAEAQPYFTPEMAKLIGEDAAAAIAANAHGKLDFDPFINGQQWQFDTYDLKLDEAGPGKMKATVRFQEIDTYETVYLQLAQTPDGWRIADIAWSDGGPSLRAILTAPAP
jgi:hypothetical protein